MTMSNVDCCMICMTVVCIGALAASWFLKDANLRGMWKLGRDDTYGIQGRIRGVTDRPYVHYVLEHRMNRGSINSIF